MTSVRPPSKRRLAQNDGSGNAFFRSVRRPTDDDRRRAARFLLAGALDADEAAELLDAAGLAPRDALWPDGLHPSPIRRPSRELPVRPAFPLGRPR